MAASSAGRGASGEDALEAPIRLHDQRLATVVEVLQGVGAKVRVTEQCYCEVRWLDVIL